ncbi:MAG: anthranilate synthase component I family protein [Planctomycetota bacterium]
MTAVVSGAAEPAADQLPLVHELTPAPDAVGVFRRMAALRGCVFFDSARPAGELGRYSFVAAEPFATIAAAAADDPLRQLDAALGRFRSSPIAGLPPFQGGAAGWLGYELGHSLEALPRPRWDEFCLPDLAAGLYDVVVAFDHLQQRAWVVSQGFPEQAAAARRSRAEARLAETLDRLARPPAAPFTLHDAAPRELAAAELAPQSPAGERDGVTSDFSREAYLRAVARAVEYIHAGDIFQVNLSQRLLQPSRRHPVETYLALRERNPAPFAGYYDAGLATLCSASPERFVSVRGGVVETRPIKGTRCRSPDGAADRIIAQQLLEHPKDRAENTMIVDLLRNDLSRVCTPESVRVPKLCGLESYEHVHHLVSVVTGELAAGATAVDLLRASWPGGSITGAPKVRAMEIIAELEPTARGPYCGSLAYAGFNGAMDSSILIRSLIDARGWLQAPVGGGIVADSDPEAEYQETWHKAAGLLEP